MTQDTRIKTEIKPLIDVVTNRSLISFFEYTYSTYMHISNIVNTFTRVVCHFTLYTLRLINMVLFPFNIHHAKGKLYVHTHVQEENHIKYLSGSLAYMYVRKMYAIHHQRIFFGFAKQKKIYLIQ
jgi:hypothetical protein